MNGGGNQEGILAASSPGHFFNKTSARFAEPHKSPNYGCIYTVRAHAIECHHCIINPIAISVELSLIYVHIPLCQRATAKSNASDECIRSSFACARMRSSHVNAALRTVGSHVEESNAAKPTPCRLKQNNRSFDGSVGWPDRCWVVFYTFLRFSFRILEWMTPIGYDSIVGLWAKFLEFLRH